MQHLAGRCRAASTRLILLHGDAGKIIQTFGDFVAGGSFVVGLVIFLILVVIQFIVITKGAERISEVSARFTLDAMPGKQMAIDADLNAGMITETQANKRREKIVKEAEFYGAMDGASKFIRGDAEATPRPVSSSPELTSSAESLWVIPAACRSEVQ